jgi:TonB family protein
VEGLSTATAYRAADGKLIGPPRKTKHVNPESPENAKRAGLTGAVVLKCFIGTDGKVKDIQVISGYSSLAAAATKAVRQWEFTPTTLDGAPVPVEMTVTTNFTLTGSGDLKPDDVVKATGDADPDIRLAAVTWLGSRRPTTDKQLKAIQTLVRDPNPAVQTAATRALESLNVK